MSTIEAVYVCIKVIIFKYVYYPGSCFIAYHGIRASHIRKSMYQKAYITLLKFCKHSDPKDKKAHKIINCIILFLCNMYVFQDVNQFSSHHKALKCLLLD